MNSIVSLAVLVFVTHAIVVVDAHAESSAGHAIQLFDGETLFGWDVTSEANWRVEDNAIHVDAGEPGFLRHAAQFSDFELTLEFRAAADSNSGVFVRAVREPKDPESDCYEVNIAGPTHPFPLGSLVGRQRAETVVADDRWRRMIIRAVADKITTQIDDQVALEYTDPNPRGRGHIALQFNKGLVSFRNIQLQPMGLKSMLAENGLEGWQRHPAMKGKFECNDGLLSIRGGSGQLESTQHFGNFVLQLECRTNAANLNSGVFFRCIPGDKMMGYESQIHNGFENEDRTQPTECGTGGIFRRQNARRVVANDLEWFRKTIVVNDKHMAVWVDGFPVSSWTDTRKPDQNPRRGCRVEAGSIIFQAHDPTTDISVRNVLAAEL